MTITRERKPHHSGRQAGGGRHPRPGQRPYEGIWNFHRNYAECGGIGCIGIPRRVGAALAAAHSKLARHCEAHGPSQ